MLKLELVMFVLFMFVFLIVDMIKEGGVGRVEDMVKKKNCECIWYFCLGFFLIGNYFLIFIIYNNMYYIKLEKFIE